MAELVRLSRIVTRLFDWADSQVYPPRVPDTHCSHCVLTNMLYAYSCDKDREVLPCPGLPLVAARQDGRLVVRNILTEQAQFTLLDSYTKIAWAPKLDRTGSAILAAVGTGSSISLIRVQDGHVRTIQLTQPDAPDAPDATAVLLEWSPCTSVLYVAAENRLYACTMERGEELLMDFDHQIGALAAGAAARPEQPDLLGVALLDGRVAWCVGDIWTCGQPGAVDELSWAQGHLLGRTARRSLEELYPIRRELMPIGQCLRVSRWCALLRRVATQVATPAGTELWLLGADLSRGFRTRLPAGEGALQREWCRGCAIYDDRAGILTAYDSEGGIVPAHEYVWR